MVERVLLELTSEELETLLRWAETATRSLYPSSTRYLSETEDALYRKLEGLAEDAKPDQTEQ